jgi:hypothetical protein
MTIASVGNLGTAVTPKSSGTTQVVTAVATAEVGQLVVVSAVWDNTDTTDGETTRLTLTDSAGNTWTKVKEYTQSAGVAADGVTVAQWYSVITSQIDSGSDTFTVTSDTARTAKCFSAWEYDITESAVAVQDATVNGGDTGDPSAISLAGMPSREYLLTHVGGEGRGSTWVKDADYATLAEIETSGGGSATNLNLLHADRIATLTGDTVDAASNTDTIFGQILSAIYEVTGGGGTPRELAAAGGTLSGGSSALSTPKRMAVSALTRAGGSSALSTPKRMAAAALTRTNGSAVLVTPKRMVAAGTTLSAGAARLVTQATLAAAGATLSGGAAALSTAKKLAASALTRSGGDASTSTPKKMSAAGTTLSGGDARLDAGEGVIADFIRWMHIRLGIGTGP